MPRKGSINIPPTKLDQTIADACYRLANPKLELVLRGLTWFADEKLMVAGTGVAWLGIRACSTDRVFVRTADQMLCSVAIAAVLPHILKLAFVRERPDRTRVGKRRKGIPKSGKAWDSFPSGHAVHVGALAAAVTRMAPQRAGLIWSSALALAGTRILLLAHHLTDVIAGCFLGLAIDGIVARVFGVAGVTRDQKPLSQPYGAL
jgi:membrane-associated phospholipid phosphatase